MAGHRVLKGIDLRDPLGDLILHAQLPFYICHFIYYSKIIIHRYIDTILSSDWALHVHIKYNMGEKIVVTIYIHCLSEKDHLMQLKYLANNNGTFCWGVNHCVHHIGEYCNGTSVLNLSYAERFSNCLSIKHRHAHKNSKMRLSSLTLLVTSNQNKNFASMSQQK